MLVVLYLCLVQWCIKASVNHLVSDPFSSVAVAFVSSDSKISCSNSKYCNHRLSINYMDIRMLEAILYNELYPIIYVEGEEQV